VQRAGITRIRQPPHWAAPTALDPARGPGPPEAALLQAIDDLRGIATHCWTIPLLHCIMRGTRRIGQAAPLA
jgi:hypothetical protein